MTNLNIKILEVIKENEILLEFLKFENRIFLIEYFNFLFFLA